MISYHTGFMNFGTLMVIINAVKNCAGEKISYWGSSCVAGADGLKPGPKRKLTLKTELLMTFMWMR